MRWGFFLAGVLALLIGGRAYLSEWDALSAVTDVLSRVPTFGLGTWVFLAAGAVLLYFSFRR